MNLCRIRILLLLSCVFLAFGGPVYCQDPGGKELPDEWTAIPFSGRITMRRTMNYSGPAYGGKGRAIVNENVFAVGTVVRCEEERNDDGALSGYQAIGYVQGDVNLSGRGIGGDATISEVTKISDRIEYSYRPTGSSWCGLKVNPGKGLIRLSLPDTTFRGGTTKTTMIAGGQRVESSAEGSYDLDMYTGQSFGVVTDEKYTPGSPFISGSCTATLKTMIPAVGVLRKVPVHYEVTWFLQIGKPKARLVLETDQHYDKWVPALAMGTGNTLAVTAKIIEPQGVRGRIEFTLEEVGREPGECMNHPNTKASDDFDLVIHPKLNGANFDVREDGQKATTTSELEQATILVQANDWGAYGQVRARAFLLVGGEEVEVDAVYEPLGAPCVAIPRDDNSNSIADCWERDHGVEGCGGDFDDDGEPAGKGPGDGLSAYEEYRGFYIQNRHHRLNPKKKDLFVFDQHGLMAGSYLPRATGLEVHYVLQDEINATDSVPATRKRVVNFNHDRHHLVDQHGLWVVESKHDSPDPFVWGLTGGKELGPPGTAEPDVKIYAEQIRTDITKIYRDNLPEIRNQQEQHGVRVDETWLGEQIKAATNYVTAHECCHGLGIGHHLESAGKSGPPKVRRKGVHQGQWSCVIRYVFYDDEILDILSGQPWPKALCETNHDCRHQLTVSDRDRQDGP